MSAFAHLRDALPNASYLGFTGTPIELGEKNTKAVFGDYIDIYDISRAVEDGVTVKIYYEGRLAKLELTESERPKIDEAFEDAFRSQRSTASEKGVCKAFFSGHSGGAGSPWR